MDKIIAKRAGLIEAGFDKDGEQLFMGTEAQWQKAQEMQEVASQEVDLAKEDGDIELSNTHPTEGFSE